MSLLLPSLDTRITLKGSLGVGGMGEVHRAWDAALERAVAIKFVRGSNPKEADQLLLEARLQARVDHPHVVKVHEVGTLQGRPCIVLQLIEGHNLSELTQRLNLEAKVNLLRQVAEGLHAAHCEGLVHRDIKPSNVLVEEQPEGLRALVSDFGLAREQEGGLSRSGLQMGTLDFMSPEQLLGHGPLDFRSDVYALGASLYSIVAGRPPFRGHSTADPSKTEFTPSTEDPSQMLRRILDEDPPSLKDLVPGLPAELPLIVAKAMEKDPAQRYASAEAFAKDLGRFQRGEPILARRAPLAERFLRWSRRNKVAARALATAAAAVLLGAGLAIWISRRAGVQALEAARLGAEAAAMREEIRAEYLSPAHDLRPARAALRLVVQSLEKRPGVKQSGAGAFAVGTGRELLGDHDGAQAAFEEAWRLGFRTPETAVALGASLARQYEQKVTRLGELLDQEANKTRLAALAETYAKPASRMLSMGPRSGWQEPYSRGRIALLACDFPTARFHAAQALAVAPQRYEALMLEGEAWLREARTAMDEKKTEIALSTLDRAIAPLQRATAWGRSDPGLYELMTLVYRLRSTAMQRLGQDPAPSIIEAEHFASVALALDPDAWAVHVHLGVALESRSIYLHTTAPREALAPLLAGLTHLRKATELAPTELEPLTQLAYGLYVLGTLQNTIDISGKAHLEEGLQVAARARKLAPDDPLVLFQVALLGQQLGSIIRDGGNDATAVLRTSLEASEQLLKMKGISHSSPRTVFGAALTGLGREDWLAGRDPRTNLARAVEETDLARLDKPNESEGAVLLGDPVSVYSEMGLLMGDDVRPILRRGLAALDSILKMGHGLPLTRVTRAELVAIEARRRFLSKEDPLGAVAEARSALLAEKDFQKQSHVLLTYAQLDVVEAAWRITQGQNAEEALKRAERRLQGMVREDPTWLSALDSLASVALWRSIAARSKGQSHTSFATSGLKPIRAALAVEPQHAARRLLEARLLHLAGRIEEARKTREAAASANPLLRGGAEWKAALSEAGS